MAGCVLRQLKPSELYILNCEKGLGLRPRPFPQLRMFLGLYPLLKMARLVRHKHNANSFCFDFLIYHIHSSVVFESLHRNRYIRQTITLTTSDTL